MKTTLKALILAIAIALALMLGYMAGKRQTIRQADLINVTDHKYYIGFGDEIHTYTFE